MKNVVILGSTGSVGESGFRVAQAMRDQIRVLGVVGNTNLKRLGEQAAELGCSFAATGNGDAEELQKELPQDCKAYAGMDAVCELVSRPEVDLVLCAIVGITSFPAVMAAIRAKKTIALATKEVLVLAGTLVMKEAEKYQAKIIPVDSEHSAVFQCLEGHAKSYSKILLTCSGGPFRNTPAEELKSVTWADAMKHPTWNMGEKVTLDSATLMNKALEMVEAHHLFGAPEEKIGVLIHPQSIVHSMVEFEDGAVIAHLSMPDMRFPVQYAFSWPERCPGGLPMLNLAKAGTLTFEDPDSARFPSLDYAREAIRRGGVAGAVMNAANEVAYRRFKAGDIGFTDTWRIVEQTMNAIDDKRKEVSLEEIMEADRAARVFASGIKLKG